MIKTTRAQREAIKRVWERDLSDRVEAIKRGEFRVLRSYRALRRVVQPTIGCDGAVALPIWGMWLCIEQDGYTHS